MAVMRDLLHAAVVLTLVVLPAAACASGPAAGSTRADEAASAEPPTVVFLVRHAEKADDGTADPPLTAEGRERAEALVRELGEANLDRVYTTDYRRTRETARPVAESKGLPLELYDPSDLESFARRLREGGGWSLVVGHSNTTPALVELLGGDPGPPIAEAWEYDRLYMVAIPLGRSPITGVRRYGEPSEPPSPASSLSASSVSPSLAAAGAVSRARASAASASASRPSRSSTPASWR